MTDQSIWLEKLKSGDKIIISNRYSKSIATVDKTTKTQIVVGKQRFRKRDGYQVGSDGWIRWRLQAWSKEFEETLKINEKRSYLACLDINDLAKIADEKVIAAYEILKETTS